MRGEEILIGKDKVRGEEIVRLCEKREREAKREIREREIVRGEEIVRL